QPRGRSRGRSLTATCESPPRPRPDWRLIASHPGPLERQPSRIQQKRGPVLSPRDERHRLATLWQSCLFGARRSVGSPPPDKAVWGRPPYVLPVWRYVIRHTTEMIIALSAAGREPSNFKKPPRRWTVERTPKRRRLEIPMAVTEWTRLTGIST